LTQKKTLRDIDVGGRTVLVRVDYNVPFYPGITEISDDGRIRASLPTLRYLIDRQCKLVLCSHLGRPKGRVVEELRVAPVARRLCELLAVDVPQAPDCIGPEVRAAVGALGPGDLVLLENLRFHPEEEENDPEFAASLASLAEVYVDDAFGTAHRAHASTEGVTRFLPSVAGLLMTRELEMLGRALGSPESPFAAIIGGAKVSDKIAVLENLAGRVDVLVIGGGMAATFLRASGLEVGESLVEEDGVTFAAGFIHAAKDRRLNLLLPVDVVIADSFSDTASHRTVDVSGIPPAWRIMDIGPRTASLVEDALESARTVVWNGPMGVFEWGPFSQGTVRVANVLASLRGATTVVGGGSTAEAVESLGLADRMTHVSTGGGASLEFLEGKVLPGVAALMDKDAVISPVEQA
jgi:phosphoglycerate kinase